MDGKPIEATRIVGRPPHFSKNPKHFSLQLKTYTAMKYAVWGDVDEVSRQTNIPAEYIRQWKEEPWWIEIQKKVYVEQNEKLSSTISSVLDTAMAELVDRLENGDEVYDQKRGQFVKQKINAKTLTGLFTTLSQQRRLTRGEPTSISATTSVSDRLKGLEAAFIKFTNAKELPASYAEVEDKEIDIPGQGWAESFPDSEAAESETPTIVHQI